MDKKLFSRVNDIYTGAIGHEFKEGEDFLVAEDLSRVICALQNVFDPNGKADVFYSKWNIVHFESPKTATEHLVYAIRHANCEDSKVK